MDKYSLTHLERHSMKHVPQYSMSSLTWSSLEQETSSPEQGMSATCWRLHQLRDLPESSRRGSMGYDDTAKGNIVVLGNTIYGEFRGKEICFI